MLEKEGGRENNPIINVKFPLLLKESNGVNIPLGSFLLSCIIIKKINLIVIKNLALYKNIKGENF